MEYVMNKLGKMMVVFLLVSSLSFISGCKKDGLLRVYGSVTWKGQPVPAGVIHFNPDTSKGNTGPSGYVLITDGHFDTSSKSAKGCKAGPYVIVISGADGLKKSFEHPYGNPLFKAHRLEFEIPADGGEINFEIPDSVPALPLRTAAENE
jgi:hypothetical protein